MKSERTILVVEDEKPLQEAIADKLKSEGFQVVTARTASQAIEYMETLNDVNALWLDHYLLGSEDGLSIVAHCKGADSKCKKVPIFVVSNTASADKVQAYMQLGIEKYYVKAEVRLDEVIADISKSLDELESNA